MTRLTKSMEFRFHFSLLMFFVVLLFESIVALLFDLLSSATVRSLILVSLMCFCVVLPCLYVWIVSHLSIFDDLSNVDKFVINYTCL